MGLNMDRLTGYNSFGGVYGIGMGCGDNTDIIHAIIKKLAEYEDLEEQGRLVILPCKVGDSFFTYSWICSASNDDYQLECDKHDDCNECPYNSYEIREWKFKNAIHILNAEEHFGKTIFLTREEAETALNNA